MKQQVFFFGEKTSLSGILTEPTVAASNRPLVIFLNHGSTPHIGPAGIHVELADDFAAAGFSSFQFDPSGSGDNRGAPPLSIKRSLDDLKSAADSMASRLGVNEFIVFGLGSGADRVLQFAGTDPRVAGVILLNGPAYPNMAFRIRSILRFDLLRRRNDVKNETRKFPDLNETRERMKSIAKRGSKIFAAFSGGAAEYFNHPSQFKENFPEIEVQQKSTFCFIPEADYAFNFVVSRRKLRAEIAKWASDNFGSAAARPIRKV